MTVAIYAKIDEELHSKAKAQSALSGVKPQEFVANAIRHYSEHIENKEIDLKEFSNEK